jgi:hypothetical protein
MNKQISLKKAIIMAVLASILVGSALGAIIIFKQVPMSMRVKMSVALGVFDTDAYTPLTSINLGDFLWGEVFVYPGKLSPESWPTTQFYYVNNTDQTTFHGVQFIITGLPANAGWGISIRRMDEAGWTTVSPADNIFKFDLTSPSLDPEHPLTHAAQFYLTVWTADNVPFGDFAPTLTVNALDSTTE